MADTRMQINKGAVTGFISKYLSPTLARQVLNASGTENFGLNAITLQGAASFIFTPSVSDTEAFGILGLPRKGSDEGDYALLYDSGGVVSASVMGTSISHFNVGKPYVFDSPLSLSASFALGAEQASDAEMSVLLVTGGIE
jgi:hypothetical protein